MAHISLGLSPLRAANGKLLMDGSSAISVDGRLISAIPEERLTRTKRQGGWQVSASYCLEKAGLTAKDVTVIGYSTCTDRLGDRSSETEQISVEFPNAILRHVSHHLSHALYAFVTSPFERSIVAVSDAGGNTFEPGGDAWWRVGREQTTYYLADERGIRVVDRDFDSPLAVGFGETFRAVTYYLGWLSDLQANKTMALSAFGRREELAVPDLFCFDENGQLSGLLNCNPLHPIEMVRESLGGRIAEQIANRAPDCNFVDGHAHLAALVQASYERALEQRLGAICQRYDTWNVCLSGGVAYNCQANSFLARSPKGFNVWIPAAPGDSGQSLGNCLVTSLEGRTRVDVDSFRQRFPSANRLYGEATKIRSGLVGPVALKEPSHVVVSHFIQKGLLVGVFRGASEFGARALGNTSIFADPSDPEHSKRLNEIKCRESFMPFGGSILEEDVAEFFVDTWSSPYMQFVFRANAKGRAHLPAIIHRDGTSRLQTVDKSDDVVWLRNMLAHCKRESGTGVVLNTSLNLGGKPIAQYLDDAVEILERRGVDVLVFDDSAFFSESSFASYLLDDFHCMR